MEKLIQISAGQGPAECGWVVAQVLKLFIEDIKKADLDYSVIQREKGSQNGTVQSVIVGISGKNLSVFLNPWLGTIQWIGTSSLRKNHKRKNWFICRL